MAGTSGLTWTGLIFDTLKAVSMCMDLGSITRCCVDDFHYGEWTNESVSPFPRFYTAGQIPSGEPDLLPRLGRLGFVCDVDWQPLNNGQKECSSLVPGATSSEGKGERTSDLLF